MSNISLLEKLLDNISLNKDPNILHSFKDKILNVKYQQILMRLFQNDPPSRETLNVLNDKGLTPFLAYIEFFTVQHDQL